MNRTLLLATSGILLAAQLNTATADEHQAGKALYETNCAACHGATGGMDLSKRIAPPIAAVRMHYIETYPEQDAFVKAVSSWVAKQDEANSLMRGAIRKFNLMPPVAVSPEDAQKIAAFIYGGDIDKPEGFKEHVNQEHAKEGRKHQKDAN